MWLIYLICRSSSLASHLGLSIPVPISPQICLPFSVLESLYLAQTVVPSHSTSLVIHQTRFNGISISNSTLTLSYCLCLKIIKISVLDNLLIQKVSYTDCMFKLF